MEIKKFTRPIIEFCCALWRDINQKRIIGTASNLTYSTLLAFVPILAVVFAVARGFGYSIYIEQWFRDSLESQPQAADTIIGFVNSYLIHTKRGMFFGVGLLFMLWTTLMLISNIESAFNDIWQVKRQRSIFRTITDYITLLFIIPIVIIISSGLSLVIAAFNFHLKDTFVLGPLMSFIIAISPFVLLSIAFTALYVFMPNTKVQVRHAIWPGIIAGVSMQTFQYIYINSQIWISSYNAIYGSFAIIPFFLLWLQTSWIICLLGAELSYTRQNSEDFLGDMTQETCFRSRVDTSWKIINLVIQRFKNREPSLTAEEIKKELGITMRNTNALLFDLQRIHVLAELVHDEKGDIAKYLPAESLDEFTKETLTDRLAELGANIE